MFAWVGWNICYCIYSMVVRVFWLLVDDYWLSWWKDLISSFPLLSFFIFLLVCLPVLIHQLLNSTIPAPLSPPPELMTSKDQLPNTFTPPPSPNTRTYSRNVTGDLNNMSTVVIGSQFCSNSKIELTITGKTKKSKFDNFCVKDGNGKIIFKIKEGDSLFHAHRILVDDAGTSILSMKRKLKSTHHRWQAFKGDSTNIEDLLFIAKRTKIIQLKTKLEVFLASNASEDICDFLVKTRGSEQYSCQISGSSGILAQMKKDLTPSVDNDTYMVTVYPNIDYAFIVSIIFILDSINHVLKLKV